MTLRADDWFIDADIVLQAKALGFSICEIPVVFYENTERSSFVRAAAIIEFVRNMTRRRIGSAR